MSLPKKISPCPIIDAIFEIRFSVNTHPNAVFGLVYSILQHDFENVKTLPILELPEVVRTQDPSLRFKPHYRISNTQFVIQIGPDVLSISSYPVYIGWDIFSKKILTIVDQLNRLSIISKVERIGIRYINFFEQSIFDNINLKVYIGEKPISYLNTVFRTEIDQNDFMSTLQIANNIQNENKLGSILDIDTFKETELESFFDHKNDLINTGHNKEKELFFSLLNDDFLETLNPEY